MHRPLLASADLTSTDLAVLPGAHSNPKARAPAAPQREPEPPNVELPRPFWGLLAEKLGALLAESRTGGAELTLAERIARREL